MVYNEEKIVTRIYTEIKESPYSQVSFCEKIGYSRVSLNNCRKNGTIPPLEVLCRMCELLNCELGYLLCEYDCKTRENADIQKETKLNEKTIERIKNNLPFRQLIEYMSKGLIPYDSDNNIKNLFSSIEEYMQEMDDKQSALAMFKIQESLTKLKVNIQYQEKNPHKRLF